MDAVIVQLAIDEDSGRLLMLADELAEDARCMQSLVGMDEEGAILVTIWEPDTVGEVERGLRAVYSDRVRRMQLVDPRLG